MNVKANPEGRGRHPGSPARNKEKVNALPFLLSPPAVCTAVAFRRQSPPWHSEGGGGGPHGAPTHPLVIKSDGKPHKMNKGTSGAPCSCAWAVVVCSKPVGAAAAEASLELARLHTALKLRSQHDAPSGPCAAGSQVASSVPGRKMQWSLYCPLHRSFHHCLLTHMTQSLAWRWEQSLPHCVKHRGACCPSSSGGSASALMRPSFLSFCTWLPPGISVRQHEACGAMAPAVPARVAGGCSRWHACQLHTAVLSLPRHPWFNRLVSRLPLRSVEEGMFHSFLCEKGLCHELTYRSLKELISAEQIGMKGYRFI